MITYNVHLKDGSIDRVVAQEVGVHPSGGLILSNGGTLIRLYSPEAWSKVEPSPIHAN